MLKDFSHLQMIPFNLQLGDKVIPKIAMFNCNKLPTGVAYKCIETDTYNPYLLVVTEEQFNALFLDDGDNLFTPPELAEESSEEEIESEEGKVTDEDQIDNN